MGFLLKSRCYNFVTTKFLFYPENAVFTGFFSVVIIFLGSLGYIGRKDNQVKIKGHRIELEEIEHWVMQEQEIADAAVCIDDSKVICFFKSNEDVDIDILRERMKSFLPTYMIPYRFVQVKDFEYTISNKIDKKALVKKYYENHNKNISDLQKEEEKKQHSVSEKVKSLFSDAVKLDKNEIDLDAEMSVFGLDSIQFVSFVVELEEIFGFEFEEKYLNITEFKTLNDIVKLCEKSVLVYVYNKNGLFFAFIFPCKMDRQ